MQMIKEWQLKQLREEYPIGTRVELIHVDNMGTIHVSWDCGSGLGLIPGEDEFKKI